MSAWYLPSNEVKSTPWLSPDVTEYLKGLVRAGMRVLEHGSGGSTLWLAAAGARVTAVENNPDWYAKVSEKLAGNGNVELILWDQRDALPKLDGPYDLVLIDGVPVDDRGLYLEAAHKLVKKNGWLVLDNCNRPEYADARERMQKYFILMKSFIEPAGRYLRTEFYQRKGREK